MAQAFPEAQSSHEFDPTEATSLVRAALEPDERKFFKAYLGRDKPTFLDIVTKGSRFKEASALRGEITNMVVGEAYKQSQAPTVGHAMDIDPNFPLPQESMVTRPGPLLQPEGMDVQRGTQSVQVPDTHFQGPMPGVRSALGDFTWRQKMDPGGPGLSLDQAADLQERVSPVFEEGPRPTRTAIMGTYGPDEAPSQFQERDRNMKLPLAFQSLLAAKIHQQSLQPQAVQPHYPSAEEQKYTDMKQAALESFVFKNGRQPTPVEVEDMVTQAGGGYNKGNRPGTAEGDKIRAEADEARVKAEMARERSAAEVNEIYSRTANSDANAKETLYLLEAKKRKLEAEATLAEGQGSKESISAFYKEQQALLNRAGVLINTAIEGRKGGKMDDNSYSTLMKLAMQDLNVGLKAEATQRGWLKEHLGIGGAMDVTIDPSVPRHQLRPDGPQSGVSPSAPPQQSLPAAPLAPLSEETPAPKEDLSKAPAGKNKGDILKKGGKPVAKWDGSKWIPLE